MEVASREVVGPNISEVRMMIRKFSLSLCMAVAAAAVTGLSAAASAQETAPTPAPSEPAPARQTHGSSMGGPGLGVGASAFVNGPAGPEVVYDFGLFHLGGLLAFDNRDVGPASRTIVVFGVSGWYHLSMGTNSDFSVGGGIGYAHNSAGAGSSAVTIDPGAMVRAFVTPNVAVHARLGFQLAFDNAGPIGEHFGLDSNLLGAFGFTYFFGG
jgi:hypothetical protein